MLKKIENFPSALRKQIYNLALLAGGCLLLLITTLLLGAYYLSIAFGVAMLACCAFIAYLYNTCSSDKYVTLRGVVTRIENPKLIDMKVVKGAVYVYMQADDKMVRLTAKEQLDKLPYGIGDTIQVLIANNTPVYEEDGCYRIHDYLSCDRCLDIPTVEVQYNGGQPTEEPKKKWWKRS